MAQILEGCKVIDLSRFIAGPYRAMMLGDMGMGKLVMSKEEMNALREDGVI